MQKVINGLAIFSGLVSLTLVAGAATIYIQRDCIVDDVKEKVTKEVTEAITGALPGMIGGMMPEVPELPGVTGGVSGVGGGVALPF